MKYGRSDCSVFFEQSLLEDAKHGCSDDRLLIVNQWYPDKNWYDKHRKDMNVCHLYDFLDNGKTSRDHNLFIRCMRKMPDKTAVIVTDRQHVPSEYKEGENITLYFQDKPNDLTMLQLCLNSKVMVIPLEEKNSLLGPIGGTSFMDAIAVGMPVVTNKKASFAQEVSANSLGTLFDLNEGSMTLALMDSLSNYDRYHESVLEFSRDHTIDTYSNKLRTYIE